MLLLDLKNSCKNYDQISMKLKKIQLNVKFVCPGMKQTNRYYGNANKQPRAFLFISPFLSFQYFTFHVRWIFFKFMFHYCQYVTKITQCPFWKTIVVCYTKPYHFYKTLWALITNSFNKHQRHVVVSVR